MQCPKCQHTNPEGARFCNHCAFDLSRPSPASASTGSAAGSESERRQATVLFSDLSGFTAMTERLDPEEVKDIMGRIFGEAARAIANYGGTVEKYIGDAVMALFGVPVAHEDDPPRHCPPRENWVRFINRDKLLQISVITNYIYHTSTQKSSK